MKKTTEFAAELPISFNMFSWVLVQVSGEEQVLTGREPQLGADLHRNLHEKHGVGQLRSLKGAFCRNDTADEYLSVTRVWEEFPGVMQTCRKNVLCLDWEPLESICSKQRQSRTNYSRLLRAVSSQPGLLATFR